MTTQPRSKSYTYFPGDKDTLPKTAGKAHTSAVATLGMVLFAFWGYGEAPTDVALSEALMELGMSILAAGISWVVAYYKANYVKKAE